ncbi:MAG: alpha/beta hydrolase [Bacteroidota bacterium]
MRVYGIGGLGVDERVFAELTLEFEITPLPWIQAKHNESLQQYAQRFADQIKTDQPFSIIGISFGGMMAIELNKILDPRQIILISSATSKNDIPRIFRVFGKAGLLKLTPRFLMKPPPFIANWFFGVSEPKYKRALRQIIADTDIGFLRWATNEIVHWDNRVVPKNMIRIHGSKDRLLYCNDSTNAIMVPDVGHFMIMNEADQLSEILNAKVDFERSL